MQVPFDPWMTRPHFGLARAPVARREHDPRIPRQLALHASAHLAIDETASAIYPVRLAPIGLIPFRAGLWIGSVEPFRNPGLLAAAEAPVEPSWRCARVEVLPQFWLGPRRQKLH